MRLVVDAGPIIALSKTGHLDLLPALFDDIVVPSAVLDEVAAPDDARPGCERLSRPCSSSTTVVLAASLTRAAFARCELARS
jgi:hypothetical protein